MSSADLKVTEIEDYAKFLAEMPTVVAGQAVNIWAKVYEQRPEAGLDALQPFTSKDLDLAGDRLLLQRIHELSGGGRVLYAGPRSPVVGSVEVLIREVIHKVEVLRDVKGLTSKELEDAVEIALPTLGLKVRVLSPPMVLKAKICNCAEIDQENRNDVKHVRIMISCVREFLRDALARAESGQITQRDAVDLFEEVLELSCSRTARKAAERWGFDLAQVWPSELRDTKLDKLARFVNHRLPKPAD